MKQKPIATALLVSLVISGSCTLFLAHSIKAKSAVPPAPDLMYAAPSKNLQAGEILTAGSVEFVAWPSAKPLQGTFTKVDALVGRATLYPLVKDQPILDREVSAPGVGAGLAAKIPEGMRAIALRSDEVVGVAGFLTPGSHVDVLGTFRTANSPDPVTAVVLENAEVLAVGQRAQPDPEGKPAPAVTVVTLLLSPDEAERAVLASSQGSVHFVLRNGADKDQSKGAPLMMSMLSGAATPLKRATEVRAPLPVRIPVAPPPRAPGIETVLGNETAVKPEGNAP